MTTWYEHPEVLDNPTVALELATKQYVDSHRGFAYVDDSPPVGPLMHGSLWIKTDDDPALGVVEEPATLFPFYGDWDSYDTISYGPCTYWKIGDTVFMQGLAQKSTTAVSADTVGIMPVGYRPPINCLFICSTSGANYPGLRVDVTSSGSVIVRGSDASTNEWVSLAGISYKVGS